MPRSLGDLSALAFACDVEVETHAGIGGVVAWDLAVMKGAAKEA